ncbi:hypothetical protein BD779DRAFT_1670967 [Infundibulicybe gibba]|nr:hypothetical protein BD779DRAFT_1670967 [Infundibulicybe gibba]
MLERLGPGASVLHIFLLFQGTGGAPSNRTIDDTNGDSLTGFRPVYLPTSFWDGASCEGCAMRPDPDRAFQRTWTAATFHPELMNISINFGFQGTAVYVFFINANNQGNAITTLTECDFYVDGAHSSSYRHTPTASTELDYNVLAFSAMNMLSSDHTISIVTGSKNYSTFLNFDYAIYTTDDGTTVSSSLPLMNPSLPAGSSTPSTFSPSSLPNSLPVSNPSQPTNPMHENTSKKGPSIGVIIGGVAGGIVALGILTALIIWHRSNNSPQGDRVRSGMRSRAPTLGVEGSFRPFGGRRTDPMNRNHSRQPASGNRTNRPSSIGSFLDNTSLEARGSLTDSYLGDLEDMKSPHIWKPFVPMPTTDPATIPRAPARISSQRKLDRLIKAAQREMRELKSEVGHRVPATFTAQPHNDAEVLNALTDQIQMMRRQIEMLQTQRSFRARTPSDAPPGYTYDD